MIPTPYSAPVSVVRPGAPRVQTTFQLALDITAGPSTGLDTVLVDAVAAVLDWVAQKYPDPLPKQPDGLPAFQVETHGQRFECAAISEEGLWSAQLTQPDAPYNTRPAVAGRIWTTEIALSRRPGCIRLGIRIVCASLPYCNAQITLTRPHVIVDLCGKTGLHDVWPLVAKARRLRSEQDLCKFRDFLLHPRRALPVVMLTQPDQRRFSVPVNEFLVDANHLAERCQGLAHIILMPRDLGFKWTELVGKPWSAFLGSVRTYWPGLDFSEDSPTAHPLATAERVLSYRYEQDSGEAAFTGFLRGEVLRYHATHSMLWGDLQFVPQLKTKQAELARQKAREDADWRTLCEEEIAALKQERDAWASDCEKFNNDAIATQKERDHYIAESKRLRCQLDTLRAALRAKPGAPLDRSIEIPATYDDMPAWSEQHLTGQLELLPRAVNALKKAQFSDVALVYQALLLLANEYRDMRRGTGEKEAFEKRMGELKLRYSTSISEERAGEEGDAYYVRYPLGTEKRQFLQYHLRKGSDKDERLTLAIYFFWDEDSEQVVVGWLPSHLDIRMT